jgi:two-component system response regulator HydG
MSLAVQVKLLRFLQDGVLERVGGTEPLRVDVRVVAATNKELSAEVRAGRFREDLFYRLDVVSVRLPPLRERREDVLALASFFLRRTTERLPRQVTGFTPAAAAALERYLWPGNVRELQHAVERAVILGRGEVLDVGDLPEAIRAAAAAPAEPGSAAQGGLVIPLGTPMEEVERLVIRRTLEQTKGDKNLAAQILGIAARTIYRKLDRDVDGRLVAPERDE